MNSHHSQGQQQSSESKHDDDAALTDFLASLMEYTPTVSPRNPASKSMLVDVRSGDRRLLLLLLLLLLLFFSVGFLMGRVFSRGAVGFPNPGAR